MLRKTDAPSRAVLIQTSIFPWSVFPIFPLRPADLQAVNLLAFRSDSLPKSVAFSLDQRASGTTDTPKHRRASGGDAACFLVLNSAASGEQLPLESKQQAQRFD